MRHGGDLDDGQAALLEDRAHQLGELARLGHVDLVERDEARTVGEVALGAAVLLELVLDRVEVADRVAAGVERGAVEHVHEHVAALDVAQELQAEALALARAGDEAGHVGDGEDRVAGGDHAEVGHQRREGVVGDLGPRGRHRGDQRGLAGAREPDERDVGDALELEDDVEAPPPARRAARSRAPCAGCWPAPRCRGRRGRRARRPPPCRGRRGRRGPRRGSTARRARGHAQHDVARRWRRCGGRPRPGGRCPRCGAGRGGTRAAR